MKSQKKILAQDITSAIETKLNEAGEQPKKVKKAIAKAAEKLAKSLIKLSKKEAKKLKAAAAKKKEKAKSPKKAKKQEADLEVANLSADQPVLS